MDMIPTLSHLLQKYYLEYNDLYGVSWVYGKKRRMNCELHEHIYIYNYRKSQLTWIESVLTSLAQLHTHLYYTCDEFDWSKSVGYMAM